MRVIAFAGNLGSGKDTAAERVVDSHGFTRIGLADPLKRFGDLVFGFSYEQLWGPSQFRNAADPRYCQVGEDGALSAEWHFAADRLRVDGPHWIEDDIDEYVTLPSLEDASSALHSWFDLLSAQHPNLSPRIMLQTLGTEYGRMALYDDIWVDICMETASRLLSGGADPATRLAATKYSEKHGLLYGDVSKWQGRGVVIPDIRFPNELKAIQEAGGKVVRIHRPDTDGAATTTGVASHASETSLDALPDSAFDFIINNDGTLDEFYEAIDVAAGVALSSK